MGIDALQAAKTIEPGQGWRWMFLIGAPPRGDSRFFTRNYLKEPEPWLRLKGSRLAPRAADCSRPTSGLLAEKKRWRKNLVVGRADCNPRA